MIIAVLSLLAASTAAASKVDHEQESAKNTEQTAAQLQRPIDVKASPSTPKGGAIPPRIEEETKPSKYEYKCNPSPSREDADSCSQRDSANASQGQFWTAIIASLVSAFAAYFTWRAAQAAADAAGASLRSADATKLQAEVAKATLEKELRPYIFVSGVFDLKIKHWSDAPFVEYFVANYGKTPAIIKSVKANFIATTTANSVGCPYAVLQGPLAGNPTIAPGGKIDEKGSAFAVYETDTDDIEEMIFMKRMVDDESFGEAFPRPRGEDHLFFRVIVEYRGLFTDGHETSACWRYDHEEGHFVHDGPNYEK